jgi:hypothetical protein
VSLQDWVESEKGDARITFLFLIPTFFQRKKVEHFPKAESFQKKIKGDAWCITF